MGVGNSAPFGRLPDGGKELLELAIAASVTPLSSRTPRRVTERKALEEELEH